MACPACGAHLLSKTNERPPRLVCSRCGKVLPQASPSLIGLLDRKSGGLLVLALLVLLPLLMLAFSPWIGLQGPRRKGPHATEMRTQEQPRWDRRSGIVGRTMTDQESWD
jgi:hypothetical protein